MTSLSPEQFRSYYQEVRAAVHSVIVGQEDTVEALLVGILADGHVLLQGVPGLGKTLLVRTIGEALALDFARIQFTPDLMPADITGTNLVVEDARGQRSFQLHKGPIFAHVILADEINRATPKTQSAMLEAMQERQVTILGKTHPLPRPNFVVATQNPLEMEGTYPLPEAQLDRFLFKLLVPFPGHAELREILSRTTTSHTSDVKPVVTGATLEAMRALVREVPIAPAIQDYAIKLLLATHPDHPDAPEITRSYVRFGASPRAAQAMLLGAKVLALLDGRYNVAIEDIAKVAPWALRHRLIRNFEGEADGVDPDRIVAGLLESVRP